MKIESLVLEIDEGLRDAQREIERVIEANDAASIVVAANGGDKFLFEIDEATERAKECVQVLDRMQEFMDTLKEKLGIADFEEEE